MKKFLYRLLLLICIGIFGFSAYQLYTIYAEKHQVEKENNTYTEMATSKSEDHKELDPDWDALRAENGDIIGWIYVPDCGDISFPVVQTTDNSYYLNHTVSRADNIRGAIFLDYAADPYFTDDNSIIYGHSVDEGGMFTDLKKFADESYFDSHPDFYLLTPSGNYICHVFVFSKTTDSSVYYTTNFGDYPEEVIENMRAQATYTNDVDTSLPMVTLSTCNLDYGFNSDQRYVLVGVLEPTDEPIMLED